MSKKKKKKSKVAKQVVGVGWYREDQWNLLLEASADRDELEPTYAEWLELAEKGEENISGAGARVEKIPIDVEELLRWCGENNRPVDGKSRAEFISRKTRERFSH